MNIKLLLISQAQAVARSQIAKKNSLSLRGFLYLTLRSALPLLVVAAASTATAQDISVNAPSFFTQDNSSNWEPGQLLSRRVNMGRITVIAYHNGVVYAGGFAGRPYNRFEWSNWSDASSFSRTAAAGSTSIRIATTSGSHGHSGKMGDYLLGGVKRTSTPGVNIEDGDFEDDFPEVDFGTWVPPRNAGDRPSPFPGKDRMQGATWPWGLPFRWPQYGSESGNGWIYRADELLGATWDTADAGVIGQALLVGNILLICSDETYSGVAAYDIGPMFESPAKPPALLDKLDAEIGGYLPAIWRNYVVFPTQQGTLQMVDFSDPNNLRYARDVVKDDNPGHRGQDYVQFQDEFAFYHGSKINLETGETVLTLDWDDSGERPAGSVSGKLNATQYAMPIGNLLVTGGRNVTGEDGVGLWVHQDEPDTRGPEVSYHIPRPNQTNYPVGAPVTLVINETLEGYTIVPGETLILREAGSGIDVDAWMSFSHDDLLTITPKDYLKNNTDYEVIVVEGGIKDVVGNGITGLQFHFTTGDSLNVDASPVISQFSVSESPAAPGETVQFDVSASDPDASSNLQYSITFGDGSAPTAWSGTTSYQHVYEDPGHYEVKIQVREANDPSLTAVEVITISIAETVSGPLPTKSSPIALDPINNRVWTVNPDADSVTRINASNQSVEQEFDLRSRLGMDSSIDPRSIAVDYLGNVWIACKDADTVAILNGSSGALIVGIDCGYGSAPVGIAASRNGQDIFVTTEGRGHEAVTSFEGDPGNGMLLRFDATGYSSGNPPNETGSLELGPMPRAIAVFGDGDRALVTRFISSHPRGGEVWDVDASNTSALSLNGTVYLPVDTTTIGQDAGDLDSSNGSGTPNYISSITITPDQNWAWYTAVKPDTGRGVLFGSELDPDNTVRTIVGRIDLRGDTPSDQDGSRIDFDNADSASAVAFSPRGDWGFVTAQGNNLIGIFDHLNILSDNSLEARNSRARIPTGSAPQGIVLDDNGHLWVQNFMGRSVTVYDYSDFFERGRIGADALTIDTVANERLPDDVLLGKQIFYHAGDERMSSEGYISCASCHFDGMGDGQVWDFTQRGEGLRNTTDLRGRAGMGHGNVHWTGNFDEIQDFENDIRNEFGGLGFLSDADWSTRQDPLGTSKAGRSTELDALTAYVTSLGASHLPKSPHREFDGEMTSEAITQGAALFQSQNCTACHNPQSGYNNSAGGDGLAGLFNVGTLRASSGSRLGGNLAGIDTPTLLGVWNAAPYLHNGSAPTLADVFNTAGGDAYEAESAQRIGGADIRDLTQNDSVSEAVGGQAVRLNDSDQAIQWSNVAGGSGGNARISIRYATMSDNPPVNVIINGATFPYTLERTQDSPSDAARWANLTLNAPLNSGTSNTIRFNNGGGTIWIDQLHVATSNHLTAAYDHTRVANLGTEDQQALIDYILQLDERSAANLSNRWTFDNDTADSVGSVDGILTGAASFSTDAVAGSHSLYFSGNGFVDVENDVLKDTFSSYTVSLWFKPGSTSGKQVLYEEGGVVNGLAIGLDGTTVVAEARDDSVGRRINGGFVTMGEWAFVAVTFDNGTLSLYLNGSANAVASRSDANASISYHGDPAGIGGPNLDSSFNDSSFADFTGHMDDLRIYDGQALSNSQIRSLYLEADHDREPEAPVIVIQPSGMVATEGDAITMLVSATGYPAPSYQWRKNGTLLGETGSSLTLPSVQQSDVGRYDVIVSNSTGEVTSQEAFLTVYPATTTGVFLEDSAIIAFEAEDGQFEETGGPSIWEVRSDSSASGGSFIIPVDASQSGDTPDGENTGRRIVTYPFIMSTDLNWRLFARVIAPDGTSDSLFVRLTGPGDYDTGWLPWRRNLITDSWAWKEWNVEDELPGTSNPFDGMESGEYNLQINHRESGIQIDKLVFQRRHKDDPAGDGPDATGTPPDSMSYADWAASWPWENPVADQAEDADPNNDGIDNALSLVADIDPIRINNGLRVISMARLDDRETLSTEDDQFVVHYRQTLASVEGLSIQALHSGSLTMGTWDPIDFGQPGNTLEVIDPDVDGDGTAQLVEVRIATDGRSRLFIKVEATP